MAPDYDAFVSLYEREARPLLMFFERRVADPELATDLLAETFTRALEHRAEFRGRGREQMSAWLWTIGRSTLSEHQRRVEAEERSVGRLRPERRELTDDEIQRIEQLAGREQLRAAAARGLAKLPADQREAVRLRVVEDLPYEEVAARLGLTAAGVRTRVWRALQRLADDLQLEWEEDRA